MKVTYIVIFSLAFVGSILALPTSSEKNINDEVEIVPLEDDVPFDPTIVDTESFNPGGLRDVFSELFNFNSLMTRMRQQIDALSKLWGRDDGMDINAGFPQIPDIDLSKGNTTSVTKVIDGHKVVINETEYKNEGDFGGAFFKVRIVDVRPNSEEATGKTGEALSTTEAVRDVEPLEASFENEIPKSKEDIDYNNIETFDEIDNNLPETSQKLHQPTEWDQVETLDEIDGNSLYPERTLSNDIAVNDLMASDGMAMNPDAELIYPPTTHRKQLP